MFLDLEDDLTCPSCEGSGSICGNCEFAIDACECDDSFEIDCDVCFGSGEID